MKKILLILFTLASVQVFSQDSAKVMIPTDAGGIARKVSGAFTIDTLFTFKMGGDTGRRILTNGEYVAQWAGVFPNGSDMTARLQRAFNHPRIKTVVITYDTTARVKLSDTLTIPEGKTLKFGNGAKLYGGGYITGSGSIDNDDYTAIFDSTITIDCKSATGHIPVTWWEDVDPTGTNISTEGIKKAASINAVATLYFPKGTGYKTDDSISVNPLLNVDMAAPLLPTDTTKPGLIIGDPTGSGDQQYRDKTYKVWVSSSIQSTWTDTNHVGVLFRNVMACNIYPNVVSGFTYGLKFAGIKGGAAYNNIYGGRLLDNGAGVYLAVGGLLAQGSEWVNENKFWGTIFHVSSGTNPTKRRYGIKIGNTAYQNNNNRFYSPTFEMGSRGVPVWNYSGSYNSVYDARDEGNSDTTVLISRVGVQLSNRDNEFTFSYGGVSMVDSSYNGLNEFTPANFRAIDQANYITITSVENIVDKISYYDSDSTLNITAPAYFSMSTNAGAPITNLKSTLLLKGDHLQVGSNAAVMAEEVDATNIKKFIIKRSVVDGYGGRIAIALLDSSGQNITSSSSIQSALATSYSTAYGGVQITGTDNSTDMNVVIPDAVKRMRVYFVSGTNVLKLKAFRIVAVGTGTTASVSIAKSQSFNSAKEEPTIGSYRQGRVIYNDMSTDTDISHWICTSPGTFGTLSGVTGSISASTNILTVNDASNIEKGNILKIGSQNLEVIGKSGTTIYLYSNSTSTLSGASIQYSAPTFKAVGASLSGGSAGTDLIKEYD